MAVAHIIPRTIVKDPRILGAEPILDGTRIPVRTVVVLMRLHSDVAAVQQELPVLTMDDVEAALHYYDAHSDEIEGWIAFDKADNDEPL